MAHIVLAALVLPIGLGASIASFDAGDAPGAPAVEAWARQVDDAAHDTAWNAADATFRGARDRATWAREDRALRTALGEVACRTLVMHRAVPDAASSHEFRVRVVGRGGEVLQEQYRVVPVVAGGHAVADFVATPGERVDPARACAASR